MRQMLLRFHSLQTGKRITRLSRANTARLPRKSFHSLQTGKPITRQGLSGIFCSSHSSLRFHSLQTGTRITRLVKSVQVAADLESFHSLQTGTRITSWLEHTSARRDRISFHSLQTGTRITSQDKQKQQQQHSVTSFHSLQTGKPIQSPSEELVGLEERVFPFPSNGKAYPKTRSAGILQPKYTVFPFPSNGKAYPKEQATANEQVNANEVSIPFKRESLSKETLF